MPKIDTSNIEGYADMTAEEKVAALEAYEHEPVVDTSGEERLKSALSKANSEAAEWKRKHNALLSEEEQTKIAAEEELKQMRADLETLQKEKALSEHKAQFLGLGYEEAKAQKMAEAWQDGDVAKFSEFMKEHQETLKKQVKSDVLQDTPRPESLGVVEQGMTQEEFDTLDYTERLKVYNEQPELYKTFTGGN